MFEEKFALRALPRQSPAESALCRDTEKISFKNIFQEFTVRKFLQHAPSASRSKPQGSSASRKRISNCLNYD